jgi:hypothetical protein
LLQAAALRAICEWDAARCGRSVQRIITPGPRTGRQPTDRVTSVNLGDLRRFCGVITDTTAIFGNFGIVASSPERWQSDE